MIRFALAAVLLAATPAVAAEDFIGEVQTSGMLFKDSIAITAFDDPTIQGVACYVTQPDRSLSWDDPTDSAIACRKVGEIKGDMSNLADVFSASKNPFFKQFHVDRFYDNRRQVLVYISYTSKSAGENASHSISVVPVGVQ